MATIEKKGQKITVTSSLGIINYKVKKMKGCISYSLFKPDNSVMKSGFLTADDAVNWLREFYAFVR